MRAPLAGLVRPPAVAGSFYLADPARLAADVDARLAEAADEMAREAAASPAPGTAPTTGAAPGPRAIVVPHAGYAYSGDVAARAYALVRTRPPRRVVIAGPAHFVPLLGSAVPRSAAWSTPLGEVPIDEDLRSLALGAGAIADERPHRPEHSLEVQLPFLQRIAPERLAILPVAVGEGEPDVVAGLLARLATVADLVVVSTDLSHYLDQRSAVAVDERTVAAVLRRDPTGIGREDACGVYALRGACAWVRASDLPVRLLLRRTSADAGGGEESVVGYAAFAIG